MERVANWFGSFEGFIATLQATEWVGVGVLLCAIAALWTSIRGSRPDWHGPSVRVAGLSALAAILFGIWFGVSIHLLIGAVILAGGCALSFWSVLLWFGIGWREHIRPGMTPAAIVMVCIIGMGLAPRSTATVLVLIAWWARRTVQNATHNIDHQLNALSTRALALTNPEAAAYLTNAWFQRFAPHASNLSLLVLAAKAKERTLALPRARRIMHASDAFLRLATFTEGAVDQRLRTDRSACRTTSWIRVLARELFQQSVHRTGIVAMLRFLSDLVLAVPPAPHDTWAERRGENIAAVPDPEGYAVALIADMPASVRPADLDTLRDRITRDAHSGGPEWLTQVATRAECLREETPNPERDLRIEIVAEVLWGVYESSIGPRPTRFDLYDQVRLQMPELVERSSVREVRVERESLVMQLEGMPRAFHELGRGNPVIVHTPDDITWSFRQLETTESGVMLFFGPYTGERILVSGKNRRRRASLKRPKEVATALAAAASQ